MPTSATTKRRADSADSGEDPDSAADAGGVVTIAMPEMGEFGDRGQVLSGASRRADSVEEGETVIEVSTDKVDAEVPAPASGTVTKLLVAARRRRRSRPGPGRR